MKIGKYELFIVQSGFFSLDGGAMFGIIPKPLWEKSNPADSLNRVTLATRNLLLSGNGKRILIDTGMGKKWDNKSKEIYKIDGNLSLSQALVNTGFQPEDITDIILTHLHFDHAGGSVNKEGDKLIPAFPNAVYHVQKKNFEWASAPSERDKGSYIRENFIPLAEEGVLNLLDDDCSFDDQIELLTINGHTFSQQMVKISDGSETLLYCADLFPFISHIPLPYIMGYDLQPMVTLKEKKTILSKAVEENWKLFFEHDPEIAAAAVQKTDKGFKAGEIYREF